MPVGEPEPIRSSINITPLVDVVLVLLIIFMVMAPQLQSGPQVELPETEQPQDQAEDERQILVTIEDGGSLWIGSERVPVEQFQEGLREASGGDEDWKVVIKGDARLSFGEVRRAMLAVERAGFRDVGLLAESRAAAPRGG